MEIVRTEKELRDAITSLRGRGSVGFVPTMGALHSGHISLVTRCKEMAAVTVVSLFVNPTQFNDKNDLKNYPRTEEADCALLRQSGCDIVFIPTVEVIYPEPDQRLFDFGSLATVMEGASRPGHFNGVGQVVSRLFELVECDIALFGEKDFQQLAIIRKMARDMGFDIQIVGQPTKRAEDGLALSSRNTLLNSSQLSAAPTIYRVLKEGVQRRDTMGVAELKEWVISQINESPELKVEYFTIVDSNSLQDITSWGDSSSRRGCIAVQVGSVRLIDNIEF